MEDVSDENNKAEVPKISGPLAEALERQRGALNARFAYAQSRGRHLDARVFSTHLVENVGPIVNAVAAIRPERVDAVTEVLFELSLDWVARQWLGPGSRVPSLNTLWREYLPRLARAVADDPRRIATALTNAVHALARVDVDGAKSWMVRLVEVAEQCGEAHVDVDTLLDAGKVLAWRCGMAHYRESALRVWRQMSGEIRYRVLVVSRQDAPVWFDQDTRPALDELDAAFANPWFDPAKHLPAQFLSQNDDTRDLALRSVGGFVGFGHEFEAPPTVFAVDGQLFARDGQTYYRIYADAFGATLQRFGGRPTGKIDGVNRAHQRRVWQPLLAREPSLIDPTSVATVSSTLALTVHHSHRIFLAG